MANEYIENMKEIIEAYKLGKASLDSSIIDSFVDDISKVYSMSERPDDYVLIYGNMLTGALQRGNRDEIADVLKLFYENYDFAVKLVEIGNNKINILHGARDALQRSYDIKIAQYGHYRNVLKNRLYHIEKGENKKPVFTGKGAVYSASFGDYDNLHDPEFVDEGLDYYFFTDNRNIKSDIWNVIYTDVEEGLDVGKMARKVKMLPWNYLDGEYDYSVWVDASILIKTSIIDFINENKMEEPLLTCAHHANDCIYEEAELCLNLKKDSESIIRAQMERYRQEGFPEHLGLTETAFTVRDHRYESVRKVCEDWWNEIKNGSRRDQLSFMYVAWKNDFIYDTTPYFMYDNYCFVVMDHKKNKIY